MISTIIVVVSLSLAAAFFLAWLVKPGLRYRIEHPKYDFQERLRRYDMQFHTDSESGGAKSDESR